MSTERLDDSTVERLLRGVIPPDDAPPGYGGVATLLQAARTEVRAAASAATEDTVTAMVAAVGASGIEVVPRRRLMRAKVAAAASAGVLALSGGMAAAGALPSAAQEQVSNGLARVGIDVPRGDGDHGEPTSGSHVPKRGDRHGKSGTQAPSPDNAGPADGGSTKTNHGACVSQVAGSGGEQVSTVARSDCGKPATAGGPPAANATPGGEPPAAVIPADKPQPTHPPQSSSGGHDTGNTGNSGNSGNGYGKGGIPSPPGLANNSARPVHEPPLPPNPPGHSTA